MISPNVDDVDVEHTGVQLVEGCLEGLRRHASKEGESRGGEGERGGFHGDYYY